MKNILILNVGTRNVLVRYFKSTCKGSCKVVVTDNFELAPALYEADKYYITKMWNEDGYWDDIFKICQSENIGMIISLIDFELEELARRRTEFERMGIMVNTSTEKVIHNCMDKFETFLFLQKEGFPVIKTYNRFSDAQKAIDNCEISFPLYVKPKDGSGSANNELVHTIGRLKEICLDNDKFIIQEYMRGNEYGIDVYVDLLSEKVVSIFAKRKLKMRAGETDKSVSYINDELFAQIKLFVEKFGLRGANDIDVFERDGMFYISEVNPRFGGGYLHAYECGVDFPEKLLNNMNGLENKPDIGEYEEDIYMMKYFDVCIKRGN